MYKLYILYSTIDFKIRYIGITGKSLDKRLYEHLSCSKNTITYKEKWINKSLINGYEIRIKKVLIRNTENEIKDSEIKLIAFLKSKNYKLTNTTSGGDGLFNPSKKVRLKISNSRKLYKWTEESKLKLSNSKKGKPSPVKGMIWSEESRLNASNSKKGIPSNNQKIIYQYDLNMNFIKSWENISTAAKYYNILITSIVNNLKKRTKTCNKYIWEYEKQI